MCRWLIDVPARLVTLWWTAYCFVLGAVIMIVVTVTSLMLALWTVGLRWGW